MAAWPPITTRPGTSAWSWRGRGWPPLRTEEGTAKLSKLVNFPLRAVEEGRRDRLVLVQSEPLMAVAGVAAKKKDGQTVSGDTGAWFKHDDGSLYVLLCDGMGSGSLAEQESALAVRLLEQFLRAGVRPENALRTLNSALALRNDEAAAASPPSTCCGWICSLARPGCTSTAPPPPM